MGMGRPPIILSEFVEVLPEAGATFGSRVHSFSSNKLPVKH